MAAEVPQNQEQKQKDPVLQGADDALVRATLEDPHDNKKSIQEKIDHLAELRKDLVASYNAAELANDGGKQVLYNKKIVQVDTRIKALQERHDKVLDTAADRLAERAKEGEALSKTKEQLTGDIAVLEAKIASLPTGSTELTTALEQKDALQKQVAVLDKKDARRKLTEKAKVYREEEAKLRSEELKQSEQDVDTALKTIDQPAEAADKSKDADKAKNAEKPTDPNAPAAAPEKMDTLAVRAARDLAKDLGSGYPQGTWETIVAQGKGILLRITSAFAGKNTDWCKNLDGLQRTILADVVGLQIKDKDADADGNPQVAVEWGKPADKFKGPDAITLKVFAKYFGESDWKTPFQRVADLNDSKDGKATLKDVEASFAIPPTSEDVKLKQVLDDLRSQGVKDDGSIMEGLAKKGYKMKGPSETPAGMPEEFTIRDPEAFEKARTGFKEFFSLILLPEAATLKKLEKGSAEQKQFETLIQENKFINSKSTIVEVFDALEKKVGGEITRMDDWVGHPDVMADDLMKKAPDFLPLMLEGKVSDADLKTLESGQSLDAATKERILPVLMTECEHRIARVQQKTFRAAMEEHPSPGSEAIVDALKANDPQPEASPSSPATT